VRPDPKIDTPAIKELKEKKCVESKEFMRAEHMKLLNDWRDSAVRDGARVYVNSEGKAYTISLQNTCMHCHSNKKKFCDECHTYMAVSPYCWTAISHRRRKRHEHRQKTVPKGSGNFDHPWTWSAPVITWLRNDLLRLPMC